MIWRRIQVPKVFSFAELHAVIQAAMGWQGVHLYSFKIKGCTIAERSSDSWSGFSQQQDLDSDDTLIADYFTKGESAQYTYDFGDCWEHKVTLTKILPAKTGVKYPVVMSGKRACPPEGEI